MCPKKKCPKKKCQKKKYIRNKTKCLCKSLEKTIDITTVNDVNNIKICNAELKTVKPPSGQDIDPEDLSYSGL